MNRYNAVLALFAMGAGLSACQPRTPAEKVQDKVEDAGHETRQGLERAGDKIEKAVK